MTPITSTSKNDDRRVDSDAAKLVTSALRFNRAKGRVPAWHYLRKCSIPAQILMRVLSLQGPRRSSDARSIHDAPAVPGANAVGAEQCGAQAGGRECGHLAATRRVNVIPGLICERAVYALQMESREYTVSLVGMYSLKKVATVTRVTAQPK